MTEDDVRGRLWARIAEAGGLRAWCRSSGLNPGYVSKVLNRKRPCSAKIAAAVGLEPITLTGYRELRR